MFDIYGKWREEWKQKDWEEIGGESRVGGAWEDYGLLGQMLMDSI